MSSNPPAERPPGPGRRPWSLRARLLTTVILLLAALCLAIGTATTLIMRDYLTGQIDQRLQASGQRSAGRMGGFGPVGGRGGLLGPGQEPGTLVAVIRSGRVLAAEYLPAQALEAESLPAPHADTVAALPTDGAAHTRTLGELGAYRLRAVVQPRGQVLVIGLPLGDTRATVYRLVMVEVLVAIVALVVASAGVRWTLTGALRPLRRVAATAGRVAELPLHAGAVPVTDRVPAVDTDPRTEVGQVGAALNRLLGHVDAALTARQASETRLRRFIADASHELRTPLAAIRGYAELAARSPRHVEVALERVAAQGTRMTALVEDLLLLARLDAGRPLEAGPVDLSALVLEGTRDAQVAGPGHHWRLDLPDEPVQVIGDAGRLHQVLANLLANASTHTPAGTTVTVGLRDAGGEAVLTVTDDGPGFPPDLRERAFERFTRGDGSRSRPGADGTPATGGTGLGLSIVAAVVGAHGGTARVSGGPGETTVTVRLPRS